MLYAASFFELHFEQKIAGVLLKVPDDIQLKSALGMSISFFVQFFKIG